jgi:hypothetical protein
MTRNCSQRITKKCYRSALGQSMVEYLVLTAAIALALGVGMVDDTSALRQLINAYTSAYRKISFAISLP